MRECAFRPVGLGSGSISAMPDRTTGARSGRGSTALRAGQLASLARVLYSLDPACPLPLLGEFTPKAFCRMAGSFLPKGQAEPVAGGDRVNGRWPFASGIHHANWVLAGVPIRYSSTPRPYSSDLTHDNEKDC